jgi:hypothetical protein
MKVILLIMIGISLLQADYIRDDDKEVVLDTTTNLMWQDDADVKTITKNWTDAIDYCEASAFGGFSDWRLPSFNELYLLADRSVYNPAISPVFTNVVSSSYWSSTTDASSTTYAWRVNFYYGYDNARVKTNTFYVRCVR